MIGQLMIIIATGLGMIGAYLGARKIEDRTARLDRQRTRT